ncbi:MAG TPA: tRNA uridine-5-carboxymethylaminomethyl(34) synthesis GTPase MnmE [Firmicutes bacterium]|nr:tRNA uridine-5-carboxymethylaminomethyl(34) synthesis GTPase MnmE [Bacillota bacterium]
MDDTICAISTPLGVGGISIIRVSGEEAIEIVSSIYKGKNLKSVPSHTINYGHIIKGDEVIDEVMVSVMRAPKTYTMEDVVEINSHGGIATTNKILNLVLNAGARLAEPGEFTKRAFLNGRIDLVQAEAVEDLIEAETESTRGMMVNQLTGKLSAIIREMKESIVGLEANIEVNIDYPEYEDIEDMTREKVLEKLDEISGILEKLIRESQTGKLIKTGIDVAIVGRPNVGKSSILNALLEEEKAIVTDIEGTTRDIVEGRIVLDGVLVNFIDTAGIRKTDDTVEKIGVDRSLQQLDTADVVVLVLSFDNVVSDEEKKLLEKIKDKRHIVFVNKDDKKKKIDVEVDGAIYGNTIEANGLDDFKHAISEMFHLGDLRQKDFTYVSNARQLALIDRVYEIIRGATQNLKSGTPVDLISIDLANARECLGEILGEVYDEELIDELFKRFCLGK